MPRLGFEPMIAVFERAKIFRVLDCTVINTISCMNLYDTCNYKCSEYEDIKINLENKLEFAGRLRSAINKVLCEIGP
jgi:hypothetical protein